MSNPIRLDIYSRPGCHLCDVAKDVIDRVRRRVELDVEFDVNLVNIESDPTLEAAYGTEIPVIFLNGNKAFKYQVDEAELERKIRRLWKT